MKKEPRTHAIKERLKRYAKMRDDIDNQIERLARLEESMGTPSSPNLTGMPRSPGVSNPVEAKVMRKLELEAEIKERIRAEAQERRSIEALVKQMEKPTEMAVIRLRYFDGAEWSAICDFLYGKRDDFEEDLERYMYNTYKTHGRALLSLSELLEKAEGEEHGEG